MPTKTNRVRKFGIIGVCLIFYSFIFRFIMLPPIVKRETRKQVELRPNKFMRGIWSHYPFFFDYNIYMYNVTNPNEIMKGAKPIVQQVGPFVYDELREKVDLVDHDEDDTVSFAMKNTLWFNPEKSNGLTGEEEITIANFFIIGLINLVKLEKPALLPIVGKGIDSLFNKPSNIFMTAKVKDILFDGFLINCTVSDFAGAAICNEIREIYADLRMRKIGENFYMLSLFGSTNGTASKARMRVRRGYKGVMKLGEVVEYNNKPNISRWDDEYCDTFNGTDGTIFHPFRKDGDTLGLYHEDLCRNVLLHHEGYGKYKGLKTYRYTASVGTDPENNPRDKCYCQSPDDCLKKGAYDAYKCFKVPVVVTNPHFYLADPYYLTTVDGLSPNEEKHKLTVELDPLTGVPLLAHSRAQLNMFISSLDKIKLVKNLPTALMPLLWFDEELQLPDFLLKPIKDGYRAVTMAHISFYCMILGGIGLCAYAGFLNYESARGKNHVNKTVQMNNDNNSLNSAENKIAVNVTRLTPAPVPANIE